ncbi:MAG: diguanylate cyclase domain-containing protein [Oscillospiraceae bacterium]
MKKIKTIGVCCTSVHKEPVKNFVDSLALAAEKSGEYRVLVFQSFGDLFYFTSSDYGARSVFDIFSCDIIDAMVILPIYIHDRSVVKKVVDRCRENDTPVISIAEKLDGAYYCDLGFGEAFSEIVEHVISVHGCKRIKVMAGYPDNEFSLTRVNSCAEVMKRYGLTLTEGDILYGNFWDGPTYEAMDAFFASGEPLPDAFVCCNDAMAIAVCTKLTEHGYRVPDDVIVTGFDGIEMERYHDPRLCTAVCDSDRMAQTVLEILGEISSGASTEPYTAHISYRPVFSESCCCLPRNNAQRNSLLTGYVKGYEEFRVFGDHMDNMENKVAANPTTENVLDVMREYSFRDSVLCLTKVFTDYFSGDSDSDNIPETSYPQPMVMFSNSIENYPFPEGTVFGSERLLPDLDSAFPGMTRTLFILPVFFQSSVMGYYVTPYVGQERHNDRLCAFSTTLNRCLEMMRLHEHLSLLNHRLSFLFTHDQLTGIYNRYGFYDNFPGSFDSVSPDKDIFIISADLNDMKGINDRFGHSAGDDALTITAKALTEAAAGDKEIICSRFGGDEFVVARVCCGDAREQGEGYRSRFFAALDALNEASGCPFTVNVSIGLFCSPLKGVNSIDSLLELADKLMYSDKARYKRRPRGILPE